MILTIAVGAIILMIVFGTLLYKANILTFSTDFLKSVVSVFSSEDKAIQENIVEKTFVNGQEIKVNSELNTPQNQPEGLVEKPKIIDNVYYKIKEGDSLWKIAERFYDDGFQYQKLMKNNTIPDPDNLVVGSKILIPE